MGVPKPLIVVFTFALSKYVRIVRLFCILGTSYLDSDENDTIRSFLNTFFTNLLYFPKPPHHERWFSVSIDVQGS